MYYNNIYFENSLLSILISIFLSLIIISFSLSPVIIKKKQINFFSNYQPIILFFLFFLLVTVVFDFLILFKSKEIMKFFFITFLFLTLLYILNLKIYKNNQKFKNFLDLKDKKLLYLFFLVFFLVSLLPISDADSIAIHQLLANFIYLNGLDKINLLKDVEFLSLSNSEILLIISPILKIENFGALLNFLSFFLFSLIIYKKKRNFIYFLISCPLMIFLVSTQKLQLFFGILYLVLFILINEKLIKKKLEIFIFILLLAFYASAKINYILFALPLYIYFLLVNKDQLRLITYYSLTIFFIVFCPIFLIKYIYFGNPVAPFFDNLFSSGRDVYESYALSLRSSEGWLLTKSYQPFLRPFLPTTIYQLSSSFGLLFFLFLINIDLHKKTKFFPILIILLIISTGQILPRYYLEAFLILSFYYSTNRISFITNIIKNIQLVFVIGFSTFFLFLAYLNLNVLKDKTNFLEKFSMTYFNSQQYKKIDLKENILDLSEARTSIFFDNRIFSTRYLQNQKLLVNKLNSDLLNFIDENSIKYIVTSNESEPILKCLNLEKIGEILKKTPVRNFLVEIKIYKSYVYKINNLNC